MFWGFRLVNSGIWLPGYYKEFFETSHAKDAAGGLLKNQADMAIIRGRVTIQNAFVLYKFAKDNLTIPKSRGCQRRIFKYYIETIPKSVTRQYKPIPGIRLIHQDLVKKKKEGELSYRSLSCYRCENCLGCKYFECENQQYTGEFVNVKAVPETNIDGENEIENDVVEDICISDLISRNSVFAVLCNDPVSDFYLVKANSESYLLNKTETDSWGVSYNKGTHVVKGNYFEQYQKNPFVSNQKKSCSGSNFFCYIYIG